MNEQEAFWAGPFGNAYSERNKGKVINNIVFFSHILRQTGPLDFIYEMGAGTGMNMEALSRLSPQTEVYGVEINEVAAHDIKTGNVFIENALEFNPPIKADLAFTKGLAIHIHPDNIQKLYERLYSVSEKYILMAEYYSPRREMIEYRGHKDKLWKASFYQEMMDAYPDLQLIGSGFVGHWDVFPQDDLTWWLWRKT